MHDHRIAYALKISILTGVYFLTAKFGLSLFAVSGFATLVWMPTGIALAALLLYGYRLWPGIAVAAFMVNLATGADPFVALGIAAGNTLEALGGAYLLHRFVNFQSTLDHLSDVLGLVFLAALGSTMISATIGVASLLLGGVVDPDSADLTWIAWWAGDVVGVLVITPLILIWAKRPFPKLIAKKNLEAIVLAAVICAVSAVSFRGVPEFDIDHFAFIVFPLLIWTALRFGMRGSVTSTFLVSVMAVWITINTTEQPAENGLNGKLLLVTSFIAVTSATFMTMAAIVADTIRTHHEAARLTRRQARLVALNRSKDEFISLASHQLRTPATGVKQYIAMLQQGFAGKLTKPQREILNVAYESNERQLQVVNTLLNVAQIDNDSVKLRLEKVDVAELVKSILGDMKPVIDERNQTVDVIGRNGEYMIDADKTKIGMVLENIISNASKYSVTGKSIRIRLKKTGDTMYISVKDQGVGIAPEDARKLFKKFTRIDNPMSNEVTGMGLGLYWANKVVKMHGGTITVKSVPKSGSTFTIKLPVK